MYEKVETRWKCRKCGCEENIWDMMKTHRNPLIDFKGLKQLTTSKIKMLKPEVFDGKFTERAGEI
ncbi:hypothetical protein [Methanobrevibacter sp. DSM 116169]|uniref:hypothetical protein n=1 Tax=Methanobrevibacter sp. DSM 116169 TaxID=3242727 RepID=UPI0038FBEAC5